MLSTIKSSLPRRFIVDMLDNSEAAFMRANRFVEQSGCEEPEQVQMLGQMRHMEMERAFRNAAHANDLETSAPHTSPLGGRYSIIRANGIILARMSLRTGASYQKPGKYLQALSAQNRNLEPFQLDFFLKELELPSGSVFGLIVTVPPRRWQNQSRPYYVGLGIPTSDLSGWLFRDSLENILSAYPSTAVENIPDRAVPALKAQKGRRADDDYPA